MCLGHKNKKNSIDIFLLQLIKIAQKLLVMSAINDHTKKFK
tara:strand:+ start:4549 stop:4671 length:123 start_codon:yes stop_codon:yes gene_type:complete